MTENKSVLVVEKNSSPIESSFSTEHDIQNVVYNLRYYDKLNVDLIWSLSNYKFHNFEQFYESIIKRLIKAKEERKGLLDDYYDDKIKSFIKLKDFWRKAPINSIEDLVNYDFYIFHVDFKDSRNYLPKIIERYPEKPIIWPSGSIAAGNKSIKCLIEGPVKLPFDFATKDPDYNTYIVQGDDNIFSSNVSALINYILDGSAKSL